MSMNDPVSDLVVRINNGQSSGKAVVKMPASKAKAAICQLLTDEGYIEGFSIEEAQGKPEITVRLKYYKGKPVIEQFQRVSKPGRRVYRGKDDLPVVLGGLGVAVISTSKGLMSDERARGAGLGGEVLCVVS